MNPFYKINKLEDKIKSLESENKELKNKVHQYEIKDKYYDEKYNETVKLGLEYQRLIDEVIKIKKELKDMIALFKSKMNKSNAKYEKVLKIVNKKIDI